MKRSITIACGGTGGHIHPAMAVADVLLAEGHKVSLILSGTRDAETKTAEAWQGPLLKSGALPLRKTLNPRGPLANLRAIIRCVRFLLQECPDVLFATGGYTSFPPVIAARLLRIPVVFHEANSLVGAAIRFCTKCLKIDAVATSFVDTAAQLPKVPTVFTGLPLRQHVLDTLAKARTVEKSGETFTILVTGGSQGAQGMNRLITPILASLAKSDPKVKIVHQCGANNIDELRPLYEGLEAQVTLTPFIDDMGTAYGTADIIIARAGAATCFEIARCGVPTIFIPLPTAADDHQRKNAEAIMQCGGAICLNQLTTTPEMFANTLRVLYSDKTVRDSMRSAFAELPQNDAARAVTDLILDVAQASN
jgi:UDP-N-acetylglucosamine--N-acetylmuramyl-(pentapeptide) pyrophosphoryl-undecaprenol N-acetylglucosamine transferase